jgi:hypothetical protein
MLREALINCQETVERNHSAITSELETISAAFAEVKASHGQEEEGQDSEALNQEDTNELFAASEFLQGDLFADAHSAGKPQNGEAEDPEASSIEQRTSEPSRR